MNGDKGSQKRATGVRLYRDQIEQLDLLVKLTRGRRDRSDFIREALDAYIASKMPPPAQLHVSHAA